MVNKIGNKVSLFLYYSIYLLIFISFFGCASTRKLIANYKPEVVPKQDETLIYLFRKKSMVGAARTIIIGCNDRYITALSSGSYMCLKVKDEIITINISQKALLIMPLVVVPVPVPVYSSEDDIPLSFHQVDNRKGETVYLVHDYTTGEIREISEKDAVPMIIKYKRKENYTDSLYNPGFKTAFFNPGILDSGIMKASDTIKMPNNRFATLLFIRKSSFGENIPLGVWTNNAFLGSLKGKEYFQTNLPTGKYTFHCHYLKRLLIEADVKAGYLYLIEVRMKMGWDRANIDFETMKNIYDKNGLDNLLFSLNGVTIKKSGINDNTKMRIALGLQYINEPPNSEHKEDIEKTVLSIEDGKLLNKQFKR